MQIKYGICKLYANGLDLLNYYKPVRKYHVLIKTKIMIMKRTQFGVNVILIKCVWARVLKNGINGNQLVLFHTAHVWKIEYLIWSECTLKITHARTHKNTLVRACLIMRKIPQVVEDFSFSCLFCFFPPSARLQCHPARFLCFVFTPDAPVHIPV